MTITTVELPEDIADAAHDHDLLIRQHEGFFNVDAVKCLVYGESGVGKTVFSATWADVIFLDANHGMSSVTRPVSKVEIRTWTDLENARKFLANSKHQYKTVVIDALNDVQYLCMRNLIHKFPSIRRAYDNLPSQSDYGKMLDDFEQWIRGMIGLSMNVVMTCNVAPREYETDNVQPQLVGKHTARNLAGMMDIIGYLYKQETAEGGEKKDRVMVFDAVNHVTKDRSGLLPGRVLNPTHSSLLKYWNVQYSEE